MRCKRQQKSTNKKTGHVQIGCCFKKARSFYRIHGRDKYNGAVVNKVFGFCQDCSIGMEDPLNWRVGYSQDGCVYNLRGPVESLEPCSESEAMDDKREKEWESVKQAIKNLITNKKNVKFSREQWVDIMQESLDEVDIEAVMCA